MVILIGNDNNNHIAWQSFYIKQYFLVNLFLKHLRWENYHTPCNKKFIEDVFSSFPIQFSFPVHWPQEYEPSKISKAPGKQKLCVCVRERERARERAGEKRRGGGGEGGREDGVEGL